MVQDIASAINRALFHQNAPAHIKIMNVTWDAKGVITAITHPNVTVEMGQKYCYIIITAARMVDKAVVHFEENESWHRPSVHSIPDVQYMGKVTQELPMMQV